MPTHHQQRVELAAGLRWAARLGMQEGVDNHFTLAVDDPRQDRPGDVFLVNPWGLHWSEVTASSLLLCNSGGDVLDGDGEEGERLAAAYGDASTLLLGGHGVVTRGVSVAVALAYTYYLEQACRVQIRAASTGLPLRELSVELLDRLAQQMKTAFPASADAYFAYAMRTLQAEEPGFQR